MLGIETSSQGIVITPRVPQTGPWRLETPLLTASFDGQQVSIVQARDTADGA